MCSRAATWPSRKCRNKLQSSIEQRPEDMEATLGDDIYQKSGFVKVSGFHLTDLSRLLFFLRCASGSASMRGPNVTSGQCFTFVCVKFGWFGLSHSCDLKCTLYNLYICTFSMCVYLAAVGIPQRTEPTFNWGCIAIESAHNLHVSPANTLNPIQPTKCIPRAGKQLTAAL